MWLRARKVRGSHGDHRTIVAVVTLGVAVAVVGVAGVSLRAALTSVARGLPQLDIAAHQPISRNTYIYDGAAKPHLLAVLRGDESRVVVSSGQIAPVLKQAVVAIEDRRFYEHSGIDYVSIARAFMSDLSAGHTVQGGSTITQQFIKNAYLPAEQRTSETLSRKLREAVLAYQLEKRWSKDKILTNYLNTIYFGQGRLRHRDGGAHVLRHERAAPHAARGGAPRRHHPRPERRRPVRRPGHGQGAPRRGAGRHGGAGHDRRERRRGSGARAAAGARPRPAPQPGGALLRGLRHSAACAPVRRGDAPSAAACASIPPSINACSATPTAPPRTCSAGPATPASRSSPSTPTPTRSRPSWAAPRLPNSSSTWPSTAAASRVRPSSRSPWRPPSGRASRRAASLSPSPSPSTWGAVRRGT